MSSGTAAHSAQIRADLLLLLTALIWGFAFVAQRAGMEHVGPFFFNGVRFALGCLPLLPFVLRTTTTPLASRFQVALRGGLLAGLFLFTAASLQQVGIVYTTAGKAGFITGLYVILVPILGLLLRHRSRRSTWTGALVATSGLYLLSVEPPLAIARGDALVLVSASLLGRARAGHRQPLASTRLGDAGFFAILRLRAASAQPSPSAPNTIALQPLVDAAVPVFYGGVMSVGVAYTLQVVAQRRAAPGHAAIILSLETVFAALGGWLLLRRGHALTRAGRVWADVRGDADLAGGIGAAV